VQRLVGFPWIHMSACFISSISLCDSFIKVHAAVVIKSRTPVDASALDSNALANSHTSVLDLDLG